MNETQQKGLTTELQVQLKLVQRGFLSLMIVDVI